MRILNYTVAAVTVIFITAAAWLFIDLNNWARRPASPSASQQVLFTISPGQGADALAGRLSGLGLITSSWRFRLLARLKKVDRAIKAGEYKLSAGLTPSELLEVFTKGRVNLHRLTIPEGYNLKQIAFRLEKSGLMKADVFLKEAFNSEFAHQMGIGGETFEGYLFPDTYHLPAGITARRLITLMVEHFRQQFKPDWRQRAASIGMTIHQVVTLASIIEKETGDAAERPLISSVFHNRLKKKMRLESDPTVIYGLKNFDGNLTRRDLRTYSPYNTYRIKGLPPGPIANPGLDAIKAALYPAQTDYLYFVAKKDGTHYFSTTIREHNRAVRKYQLGHRSRRKKS